MLSSNVSSNYAASGGAIIWGYNAEPIIESCIFNTNSAEYGEDFAGILTETWFTDPKIVLGTELTSGKELDIIIEIGLYDQYQ
jgi:hypothetical protein